MADTNGAKYEERTDSELIALLHGGDSNALAALCARYLPLCRRMAGHYDVRDPEDLAQEGMLGMMEAARRFDPGRSVPFESFCRRCITSKMLSALDAMSAIKRKANMASLPLDEEISHDLRVPAPEEFLIEKEEIRRRSEQIQTLLSSSEKDTLRLYLRGYSYAQIAVQLGTSQKSVDNALQRVRRKLKAVF